MPASPLSAKEKIVQLLDEQPADSSFQELLRELAFAGMIERGLDDVDHGRTLSHDEVRREAMSWES